MDFNTEQQEDLTLLPDTILHDCMRILDIEEIGDRDITYTAEHTESGEEITIKEYCPSEIVSRQETELQYSEHEEEFRSGLETFEKIGNLLKKGVPHMPEVLDFWHENQTAYYALKISDGDSFRRTIPIPTAIYVQSLGIMLCDTYSKLHENGLYYGAISEDDITFTENGSLILEPHITADSTKAEDLHCLVAFLRNLLSETVEAKENLSNRPALYVTQMALDQHYEKAEYLQSALIGENGNGIPVRHSKKKVKILNILLGLCFLSAILGLILVKRPPAETPVEEMKIDSIQPEIISVWIPLDKNSDESAQSEMYQKLAEGFERQHKGCGVNINLYDEVSFSSALDSMNSQNMPAVFMNTLDTRVTQKACDLSSLEFSLEDHYIADMQEFGNVLPIGCSVPVLYANNQYTNINSRTISGGELPSDTLYDISAGDFITKQSSYKPENLTPTFLADGSHPLLGGSDILPLIQSDGKNSGAVQMIPVTTSENACALQYEYYCTVNADCPENTQQVGMLWLQYLLTEEAQTILFVENYNALPLHENAIAKAFNAHQSLQVLSGLKLDSAILQEKR